MSGANGAGTGEHTRLTLTVSETAELLGISRSTAYEYVRTGELPSVILGRRVLIPRHRLQRLLDGEVA